MSRDELIEHILEVIQSESQDKTAKITMDMNVEDVKIDSVDVISILFRLEDEYKVTIDMDLQSRPEKVGDLVNALIAFIPHSENAK